LSRRARHRYKFPTTCRWRGEETAEERRAMVVGGIARAGARSCGGAENARLGGGCDDSRHRRRRPPRSLGGTAEEQPRGRDRQHRRSADGRRISAPDRGAGSRSAVRQCGDRGATRIRTRRIAFEQITALFLTNAVGPIRLARIFLDLVRDGPGIVAFMTSGLDSVANDTGGRSELYRASKAALNSLARSFAARLGGRRITVLATGWVRTDMGPEPAAFRRGERAKYP
jgi:Enoyl-(Acyl carrier protein) reductase